MHSNPFKIKASNGAWLGSCHSALTNAVKFAPLKSEQIVVAVQLVGPLKLFCPTLYIPNCTQNQPPAVVLVSVLNFEGQTFKLLESC
jgi:hypothetical protein